MKKLANSSKSRLIPLSPSSTSTYEILRSQTARVSSFISFLNSSPEPYHVVASSVKLLRQFGFEQLNENTNWRKGCLLKRGGKYYLTKNGSTLVAFVIGSQYNARGAFKIIGAHTDRFILYLPLIRP
jgi:aspartyl aminopeptidase